MTTQDYMDEYIYYLYQIFLLKQWDENAVMKFCWVKELMGHMPGATYIPADPNTPIIIGSNRYKPVDINP